MIRHASNIFIIILCICIGLFFTGCSSPFSVGEEDTTTYFVVDASRPYPVTVPDAPVKHIEYSHIYAVIPPSEHVASNVSTKLCINNTTNTVIDSENPFEKIYPASITKIMTALLVLEHGNLSDNYTLTEPINLGDPAAVSLGLMPGDQITVEELLYGLLLESANDYAVALGRYVAGDDASFVAMMNERAISLGATHTHFMNSNGLHDNNHYTTGYDLYLIFKELLQYPEFKQISGTGEHMLRYTAASGIPVELSIRNSNQFVSGSYAAPDGVTVICGKTGTTNEAGCCLIIDAVDSNGNDYITLVCGADSRPVLYSLLTEELENR